ncbi:MAG: IS110 family transposase [Pseudonocardiales bacterium]|nr:IS110 family transposase [Pseudonocardiales bacterium]
MPRMPQATEPSQDHTGSDEVIVGVDIRKDVHVAAVISVLGVLLGAASFPVTAAGYRQLLGWASGFGMLCRAGVECTGSDGAALTRYLLAAGLAVVEVNQPDKAGRRRRGKTDAIDAEAAAGAVLSGRATAIAKTGNGPVEMVRMFRLAKASAVKSRVQAINQLKAVLISADSIVRESLSGLSTRRLIRQCAQLPADTPSDIASAAVYTLQLLARRVLELTTQINDLKQRITEVLAAHAPQLFDHYGVGPDTAAVLLVTAGDNPQRLHSEASFAALCGVSPVEASSGKAQHRRLNRGGDRQANRALYSIAMSRLRWDTRSRNYIQRRISEGRTPREAIRCLKRSVAREIYQLIKPIPEHTQQPSAT